MYMLKNKKNGQMPKKNVDGRWLYMFKFIQDIWKLYSKTTENVLIQRMGNSKLTQKTKVKMFKMNWYHAIFNIHLCTFTLFILQKSFGAITWHLYLVFLSFMFNWFFVLVKLFWLRRAVYHRFSVFFSMLVLRTIDWALNVLYIKYKSVVSRWARELNYTAYLHMYW